MWFVVTVAVPAVVLVVEVGPAQPGHKLVPVQMPVPGSYV
jgi:hypothetical protein